MVEEARRRKVADDPSAAARQRNAKNQRNFAARTKARKAEEAAAIERCQAAIAEAQAERQRLKESSKNLARVFWVQQALWTQHRRMSTPEGTPASDADRALAGLKAMAPRGADAADVDLHGIMARLPPSGALAERIAGALLPQLSSEQLAAVRASAKEYEFEMVPVSVSASRWVHKLREMECGGGLPVCSTAAAAAAQEAALAASRIQDAITKGIAARKKAYDTLMACLTPQQLSMIEKSFEFEPDVLCVLLQLQQMVRRDFKLTRQRTTAPALQGCTSPTPAWSSAQ